MRQVHRTRRRPGLSRAVGAKVDIVIRPVAWVKNSRIAPDDDGWGRVVSDIELSAGVPTAAFAGIMDFSHLEVIYLFDLVDEQNVLFAGRPRGIPVYPKVGIFAQRKKERPNRLGLCTVKLVSHRGRKITVRYCDAIDGTPVLDIKPVLWEFEPRGRLRQPKWSRELMKNYWDRPRQ